MSYQATLERMETMLESFLDRVVKLKDDRLSVISGINRLDDIARDMAGGRDLTDDVGQWFADHNGLLEQRALRPAEHNRIGRILTHIRNELRVTEQSPPAVNKIANEIDRWVTTSFANLADEAPTEAKPATKITLRRGAESTVAPPADTKTSTAPTVKQPKGSVDDFAGTLDRMMALFRDYSGNKTHLMSALEDSLTAATIADNHEALVLSATIIYYLKQHGYKVEPFVKRLKEAEQVQKEAGHA